MRLVLVVAFIAVPLAEISLIVATGRAIGVPETILLLLAVSVLGAWLMKREGLRAWQALQTAATSGRLPDTELADAALVLVGGTLLLTPGVLTDVAGLLLIVPLTRPVARRALVAVASRRVRARASGGWGGP
ncbi:MAG: FxsA family protein, partial [Actinomycetes bacterium]